MEFLEKLSSKYDVGDIENMKKLHTLTYNTLKDGEYSSLNILKVHLKKDNFPINMLLGSGIIENAVDMCFCNCEASDFIRALCKYKEFVENTTLVNSIISSYNNGCYYYDVLTTIAVANNNYLFDDSFFVSIINGLNIRNIKKELGNYEVKVFCSIVEDSGKIKAIQDIIHDKINDVYFSSIYIYSQKQQRMRY